MATGSLRLTRVMDEAMQMLQKVESMVAIRAMDEAEMGPKSLDSTAAHAHYIFGGKIGECISRQLSRRNPEQRISWSPFAP